MQTNYKTQFTTAIDAPIKQVWDALTKPEIVKQYFFGTQLDTSWNVGSPILWEGEWEGQKYQDKGIVLEYIPNKKLAYSYLSSWSKMKDTPENYLWVCYEVQAIDNTTSLTISQTNYSEQLATDSEGNWASIIDVLKKFLVDNQK